MLATLMLGAVMLVAACSISPAPTGSSWPIVALPTLQWDTGACRGVGLEATLVGDPADPRIVWLTDAEGRRRDLIWPPGYTARFAPELQVIDRSGTVVFVGGERIDGGCTAGGVDDPGNLLLIRP